MSELTNQVETSQEIQTDTKVRMKKTVQISSLLKKRGELFNPVLKIADHMKIGDETCSHLEILNDILSKEEGERTQKDNKILSNTSTIIFSIFRYLNDKRLARSQFLGLNYIQLLERLFPEYEYFKDNTDRNKNISNEIINRMMSMESSDKDIMDLFISLFFFRRNLGLDNRIGDKPFDHLFFTAMIHFSFELFENRIPNNKNIFEVTLALSILSNSKRNFTIQNVNNELKNIQSNLKIELRRGSPIGFYENKCYPLVQIQTDRRDERPNTKISNGIIKNNNSNSNTNTNTNTNESTNVKVIKVESAPSVNTTENTNTNVQESVPIKSSRMKKKN